MADIPSPDQLWRVLILGYVLTTAIETPVLVVGLSWRHAPHNRVLAGLWLNACSYPIVVLVFPYLFWAPYGRGIYLTVAEIFAPLSECLLFWMACGTRLQSPWRSFLRDMAAIVAANLASFLLGDWMFAHLGWLRALLGLD
jgi:hypothetical protein